jgi:hypothetical protein
MLIAAAAGISPPRSSAAWVLLHKRVGVIGAGLLAPITIKELKEQGNEVRTRAPSALPSAPTMPWPVSAYEFSPLVASKTLYLTGVGKRFKPLGFDESVS